MSLLRIFIIEGFLFKQLSIYDKYYHSKISIYYRRLVTHTTRVEYKLYI